MRLRTSIVHAAWMLLLAARVLHAASPTPGLNFGVYGDCFAGHDIHRKLISMIMNYKSDLVFNTGNLVENSRDPEQWTSYDYVTLDMRNQAPVYPVPGPNDLNGPGYSERFNAPVQSGNRLYYSFDKLNCHFTCLNSDMSCGQSSTQYQWLKNDLAQGQKRAEHVFVFIHDAPYSAGPTRGRLDFRRALCPLFVRYGVRAVFSGQDELYYRTRRDGIVYVVTGGGGAPLVPAAAGLAKLPGDVAESVHHIVICQVVGSLVTLTALRYDGTLLDQCSMTAD